MNIEIDQSIKIEQTNSATIIGLSNSMQFTVMISAKTKQKLQREFRNCGTPRLFVYRTFAAGVALLLHHAQLRNITRATIDIEYSGKDKLLKSMFEEMWRALSGKSIPPIRFERIGKSSNAHNVSYLTMKGMQKVNKKLTYTEIRGLALKQKNPDT